MADENQAPESVPTSTMLGGLPEEKLNIGLNMAKEGESDREAFLSITPDVEPDLKTVSSEEKVTKVNVATVEMTPDEVEKIKAALLKHVDFLGKEQLTQAAYNTVCRVAISVLPALIPTISWKKDTPHEYDALVHGLCKQALEFGFAMAEEIVSATKSISQRCAKIIEKGSDGDLASPDGPVPEPTN